MSEEYIDYGVLIDDAMHIIVQRALQIAESQGLKGSHHFFISFITDYPGVRISERLKEKYPDEMTIVLQYQFENLEVTDEGFGVVLSFDNVKESIYIPFDALTAFADPSVKFGLQFRHIDTDEIELDLEDGEDIAEVHDFSANESANEAAPVKEKAGKARKSRKKKDNNVVSLDTFRKK